MIPRKCKKYKDCTETDKMNIQSFQLSVTEKECLTNFLNEFDYVGQAFKFDGYPYFRLDFANHTNSMIHPVEELSLIDYPDCTGCDWWSKTRYASTEAFRVCFCSKCDRQIMSEKYSYDVCDFIDNLFYFCKKDEINLVDIQKLRDYYNHPDFESNYNGRNKREYNAILFDRLELLAIENCIIKLDDDEPEKYYRISPFFIITIQSAGRNNSIDERIVTFADDYIFKVKRTVTEKMLKYENGKTIIYDVVRELQD